jgi:hypothetical protein
MKNKTVSLSSFLVVLVLALAIPMIIYVLQTQNFDFKISAFLNDEPQIVKVSGVNGSSFTVTWFTEKEVVGGVKINNANQSVIFESKATTNHLLTIKNLNPNSNYQYSLYSDGKEYTSADYQLTTNAITVGAGKTNIIYGQVFNEQGTGVQKGGLVMLRLKNSQTSRYIAAVINQAGGFQVDLAGLLSENGQNEFDTNTQSDIEVNIYFDVKKTPIIKKFTLNPSVVKQIPNIYLGDVNIDVMPGV